MRSLAAQPVPIALLAVALVFVCAPASLAQTTPEAEQRSPSTAEQKGETGDEQSPETEAPQPRPWNKIAGGWGDVTFTGALFVDAFLYRQDDASRQQVGDLADFEVPEIRTLRLGGTGTLNFNQPWTWVFFAAYRGFDRGWERNQDDTWTLYDLALNIPIPKVGELSIGKMREPFSLERNMLGLILPFMERAAGNDALLQSRNSGFKLSGAVLNQRVTWSGGWFPGFMEGDDALSQADQLIGRVTGLPINGRDGDLLVHLGLSSRYSFRHGEAPVTARYRGTPESFGSPDFLDTGDLAMDRVVHLGLEAAIRAGPFWASAEWITAKLAIFEPSALGSEGPRFQSFHAQAAWILTGEHRVYDRKKGVFGVFYPARDVTSGGPGLWEVAFRYSHTDLQDANVSGGVLNRWTGGLSWTSKGLIRFEANYGIARLAKEGIIGNTQILQGRAQLMF